MKFTGRETPREVIKTLENEGWWVWEEDDQRVILTNGELLYWKVSRNPTRPTLNHLEHFHSPTSTLDSSPNLAYLLSSSPSTPYPIYKE